ncbi:MAG: amidohydrolase [Bacteroidetes bacterium]|nr:amidohydrolase [Bacteroidota bacterium]
MLKEQIRRLAEELAPSLVADRRRLHRLPELSFREENTSSYLKARLDELGIPWQARAGTGILAEVRGRPGGGTIALRADMDALPIVEAGQPSYRSLNEGVMHACGHDAHMASLLGTAEILRRLSGAFCGTVRLIFQPAEELLPGGAAWMIREGVLEDPRPEAVIGQHVMPALECGYIAICPGRLMASMDELSVTIRGRGGHAAQPASNIDPVVIAAHVIVALQQVVSRQADPTVPSVLSFGRVIADGAINVIPDVVTMKGTFRTMEEGWRREAHVRMRRMAEGIAESMGGQCMFDIACGYPVLINEQRLTAAVTVSAREYLGADRVVEARPWMASEDFAWYGRSADACFYLLGTGHAGVVNPPSLHSPNFDIDEGALPVGAGLMAYIALERLGCVS